MTSSVNRRDATASSSNWRERSGSRATCSICVFQMGEADRGSMPALIFAKGGFDEKRH
jgi:hypothetical protein